MKNLLIFLSILLLVSCSQGQSKNENNKKPKNINAVLGQYDKLRSDKKKVIKKRKMVSDCVDDNPVYTGADILHKIENVGLSMSDVKVSDKEVNEFGDEALKSIKKSKKYKFITKGEKLKALKRMLKELLSVRNKPSKIKYKIHLIDDKMINAFTVGGHIIITTGIIKATKSQSALAAVIGHEIGHNEKGHLRRTIKKIKIAKEYGSEEAGQIGIMLQRFLTPAYNQPNEIEADLYGIDLCYAAGYDPRKGIEFWDKMSKKEDEGLVNSFLRSHPFSSERAKCLRKYIKLNYNLK